MHHIKKLGCLLTVDLFILASIMYNELSQSEFLKVQILSAIYAVVTMANIIVIGLPKHKYEQYAYILYIIKAVLVCSSTNAQNGMLVQLFIIQFQAMLVTKHCLSNTQLILVLLVIQQVENIYYCLMNLSILQVIVFGELIACLTWLYIITKVQNNTNETAHFGETGINKINYTIPDTHREQAQDTPWDTIKWLQNQPFMVVSDSRLIACKNINLDDFTLCPLPTTENSFEVFMQSTIRINTLENMHPIRFLRINKCALNLNRFFNELDKSQDCETLFYSLYLQSQEFDLSKHIVNVIGINGYKGEHTYILHFLPNSNIQLTNKQTLVDICRSLSHELGTNLNSINAISCLGISNVDVSNEIKTDYFRTISINSQQLNIVISSIRDFTCLEMDQLCMKFNEFSITQSLNDLKSLMLEVCQAKKIEFIMNLQEILIVNDKDRFTQVVYAILSNSIRFTSHGQITVAVDQSNNDIIVSISDSGLGMNIYEQTRLLSIFESEQFLKVSKNSVGGGLGLYISNQIVKKLNQNENENIRFTSEYLRGSTFTFKVKNMVNSIEELSQSHHNEDNKSIVKLSCGSYIDQGWQLKGYNKNPLRRSSKPNSIIQHLRNKEDLVSCHSIASVFQTQNKLPPLQYPKFQQQIIQYSLKSKCCSRVLIIDDEYFNIKALSLMMSKFETICDCAFNGVEALVAIERKLLTPCQVCKNNSYNIFFIDINMPIKDGYETTTSIKQLMNDNTINKAWCIANSGFCDLETKLKSYDSGVDHFLTKPLSMGALSEVIHQMFPRG